MPAKTLNIRLFDDRHKRFLDEAMDTGKYETMSDVLRRGLELLAAEAGTASEQSKTTVTLHGTTLTIVTEIDLKNL